MYDSIIRLYYKIIKHLNQNKNLKFRFFQLEYYNNFWNYLIRSNIEYEKLHNKNDITEKYAFVKLFKKYKNKIVIPFFDLSVGTACSLNCQKCSQWFPYLKQKQIFTAEKIINDLNNLFKYVDHVYYIAIIGGEPFLNKELDKILNHVIKLCNDGKITFVKIVTNGTIYPSENILEKLKHPQLSLYISNYPFEKFNKPIFIENRNKLLKYLNSNPEIIYEFPEIHKWEDYGEPIRAYNRTSKELSNLFDNCRFKGCSGLYDGGLYKCGRAFALRTIGNVEPSKNEYIDFSKIKSRNEMKKSLKSFYTVKYANACDWCLGCENRPIIEPAVQLESRI